MTNQMQYFKLIKTTIKNMLTFLKQFWIKREPSERTGTTAKWRLGKLYGHTS